MNKLLLIVVLLQVALALSWQPENLANISSVPFLVKIYNYNNLSKNTRRICNGVLLPGNKVLTSGYCVRNTDHTLVDIVYNARNGDSYLSENMVREIKASSKDLHLVILYLKSALPLVNEPIELYNKELSTNDFVEVYGWSSAVTVYQTQGLYLINYSLKVVDKQTYANKYNLTTVDVLGVDVKSGRTCISGDGFIVVKDGKLCGIVTYTNGCATEKYPNIFTNLASNEAQDFLQVN